ncbi:hypothetical protein Tco_1284256 [Tanacetum coccineum]
MWGEALDWKWGGISMCGMDEKCGGEGYRVSVIRNKKRCGNTCVERDSMIRGSVKDFEVKFGDEIDVKIVVEVVTVKEIVLVVHGNGAVIENMTISEYLEYEVAKEKRLWDDVRSRRSPTYYNEADIDYFHRNKKEDQEDDSDDGDTFDMWYITVEDVERIRKFFNVPADIDEIVKPLIPEPIHTTPPNDDYVAPATKSIFDELLEEFRDEILNVTMVNEEANFNPTKDLEELERLLAKEPQPNFMKI